MMDFPVPSSHPNNPQAREGIERIVSPVPIENKGRGDSEGRSGGDSESRRQRKGTGLIVRESALAKYCGDLTAAARAHKLDPVLNRDEEIERVVTILSKRGKCNAMLIGEAGVGKTALVEGLAQRIVEETVPECLLGKRILALDVSALVAGAEYRGQFEERVQAILKEISAFNDVILFIDEFHTIVSLGGAGGELNAGNILKPPLARGEFQCIGATTLNEYRRGVEKDSALARRFEAVLVNAPTPDQAISMLEGVRSRYEEHHHVRYTEGALRAAVVLSDRYISRGQLPDKALDVIDEAGSAKNVNSFSSGCSALFPEYRFQRRPVVTERDVAGVVAKISGIPVNDITAEESAKLCTLESSLKEVIIGQDAACEKIAKAVIRGRAGLQGDRPSSFLFVGPTGVGKTQIVKELAKRIFGDEKALIPIDMSEYMEAHSVSRLIGAPPGYIGYEDGGQLTERIRRHPNSIILLDEFEKAHPNVSKLLLQALEEGRLTDGQGRQVSLKNSIVVMTSNIGAQTDTASSGGFGFAAVVADHTTTGNGAKKVTQQHYLEAVKDTLPPEFVNRIGCIVAFDPLSRADQRKILDLQLQELVVLLRDTKGVTLKVSEESRAVLLAKGFSESYGARPLRRAIQDLLTDKIADALLGLDKTEGLVFTATPTGYSLSLDTSKLDTSKLDTSERAYVE
jgi:ATP-dependent Clp protease ATP-binding subunit ClpC